MGVVAPEEKKNAHSERMITCTIAGYLMNEEF